MPKQSAPLTAAERAPQVVVLGTGGTIAQLGLRAPTVPIEELLQRTAPSVSIRTEQVFQVASPDITPEHWRTLVRRINRELECPDVAGVVVTHGTDTLEETAYYLHLTVNSEKPVVLTGAMQASDAPGADGPRNLQCALELVSSRIAAGTGALVVLADRIECARDISKQRGGTSDAFSSGEYGALGRFIPSGPSFERLPLRSHTTRSIFAGFDGPLPRVAIFYSFAGADAASLRAIAEPVDGVVLAGTGNGNIPTGLRDTVIDLTRGGKVIVRSSRVNSMTVVRNGEFDDDAANTVAAGSLNPQKARILLMLGLAQGGQSEGIQRLFDEY